MGLQIIPFISLLNFFVEIVFPVRKTIPLILRLRSLENSKDPFADSIDEVQWSLYWIIFTFFHWVIMSPYISSVISSIPLNKEIRFFVALWLVSPDFQGSAWIWYTVLEKNLVYVTSIINYYISPNRYLLGHLLQFITSRPVSPSNQASRQARYINATTVTRLSRSPSIAT